jgi:Ca-activated chloride channel family protein
MRKTLLLLSIFFCLFTTIYTQTQGELEAVDKKGKSLGVCPLKHTSVKADISGFLSRVRVTQEFENKFDRPIEAVYVFPLPQNSAVDEMTMKIGSRNIRGKIMKREEARKVYEAAKNAGQSASLLDQERPNIFTQAVANIMPNEKIMIEISYVETLKYEDGSYEFMFPMVVGPRYKPASMTTEQKQAITPPVAIETRAGHDISLAINLNAGVPVEGIRSTSHEIETINQSSNIANIKLKDSQTIPNKDFILRYAVAGKKINDAVLTHSNGKGGYFNLILQPPDKVESKDVSPKEIVFVLDTSGSMSGFPIEKAKESMKMALDSLYPNDTFNLITFAGDTHVLFEKPVPPTKANLEKAQEFLASREGSGGTEMMTAIKTALEPSDSQEHLRIVCFMTDGYVGNDREIISEIQKHQNARVFSFGIGSSVNRFLLDKMASEGRGEVEYVSLKDDGTKAAKRFHERIRNPLLTDISIDWNGLQVADVYPGKINDLFSAKPLVIHGRYTKSGAATIKLKGKFAGKEVVREIPVNFTEDQKENDVLATLWARTRIDDLSTKGTYDEGEEAVIISRQTKQLITQIGIEYRLLTDFTSFVAVEEKVVNRKGKPVKVNVPVELPEGVSKLALQGDDEPPPTVKIKTKGRGSAGGVGVGYGTGSGSGGIGNSPAMIPANPADVTSLELTTNNKPVSSGVVNGKAVSLIKPAYPAAAKAIKANGTVNVQIIIDENGNVISAFAVSGHPLLRASAEAAARNSKFAPTMLAGQKVKTSGVIVYNFNNETDFVNVVPEPSKPISAEEQKKLEEQEKQLRLEQQKQLEFLQKQTALKEKLHFWLYDLVERLNKGISTPTENDAKFVKDGKAQINIQLSLKSPEVVEKLKQLGFEIESQTGTNLLGQMAVEKLAQLVEIEEVQLVLPVVE